MILWVISTHKIDTSRIFLLAGFALLLVQRLFSVRLPCLSTPEQLLIQSLFFELAWKRAPFQKVVHLPFSRRSSLPRGDAPSFLCDQVSEGQHLRALGKIAASTEKVMAFSVLESKLEGWDFF
jgi:hypothetical protein